MMQLLNKMPWPVLIIICLSLGLAPFSPPHITEKLQMLFRGELIRPIDWFDLFFHGVPWLLLLAKVAATIAGAKGRG